MVSRASLGRKCILMCTPRGRGISFQQDWLMTMLGCVGLPRDDSRSPETKLGM